MPASAGLELNGVRILPDGVVHHAPALICSPQADMDICSGMAGLQYLPVFRDGIVNQSPGQVHVAQVNPGHGEVGLETGSLPELFDGVVRAAVLEVQDSKAVVQLSVVRVRLQGFRRPVDQVAGGWFFVRLLFPPLIMSHAG